MPRWERFFLAAWLLTVSCGGAAAQPGSGGAQEAISRGNERYARAEYEAAIEEYVRVPLDAGEAYAQALYNIGVCYYELWRTEEAIVIYGRAIAARRGRYPRALYALGVALEDSGRLPEAKDAYERAIAADGGGAFAPAHHRLGVLAARAGHYKQAASHFRAAIARSKDQLPASRNNLGVMLALTGRHAEAEREFETARKLGGDDYEDARRNLARCKSRRETLSASQLILTFGPKW